MQSRQKQCSLRAVLAARRAKKLLAQSLLHTQSRQKQCSLRAVLAASLAKNLLAQSLFHTQSSTVQSSDGSEQHTSEQHGSEQPRVLLLRPAAASRSHSPPQRVASSACPGQDLFCGPCSVFPEWWGGSGLLCFYLGGGSRNLGLGSDPHALPDTTPSAFPPALSLSSCPQPFRCPQLKVL